MYTLLETYYIRILYSGSEWFSLCSISHVSLLVNFSDELYVPFKANRVKAYCKVCFSFCNPFDDVFAWCVKIPHIFEKRETIKKRKVTHIQIRNRFLRIIGISVYISLILYFNKTPQSVSFKRAYIHYYYPYPICLITLFGVRPSPPVHLIDFIHDTCAYVGTFLGITNCCKLQNGTYLTPLRFAMCYSIV